MKAKLYGWLALLLLVALFGGAAILTTIKILLIPVAILFTPIIGAILIDLYCHSLKASPWVFKQYSKGVMLLIKGL